MTSAELRQLQILAGVIGFGSVLFFMLSFGLVQSEAPLAPEWWTPVAVAGTFGVPVLVAALVPALPLRRVRIALVANGVVYLATLLSTLVFVSPNPSGDPQWVAYNTAAAICSFAFGAGRLGGWAFNALVTVVVLIVHLTVSPAMGASDALHNTFYTFMFSAVFLSLGLFTIGRARRLDDSMRIALASGSAAAAAAARDGERQRVDALLHDTVLATLRVASGEESRDPETRAATAALARRALGILQREIDVAGQPSASMHTHELDAMLRQRLAELDGALRLEAVGASFGAMPVSVASAITDATVEAARNSLQHSRSGGPPAIGLEWLGGDRVGVRVVVADDGVGFDPERVPGNRLGLRLSVLRRVGDLPGGRAEVVSAPGRGTRVELEWQA